MCEPVEDVDGEGFDEVGDEIAVPQLPGGDTRHYPEHRNHGQRQGERDEERHLVLTVKLIDNHQHINIAERDETESENPEGMCAFSNQIRLISTE